MEIHIVIASIGATTVYTFLGPYQSSLCAWNNPNALFGTAINTGDANFDGLSDVLIGDPNGFANKGRALLFTCGGVWSWGSGPLTFQWIQNAQNPQVGIATVTGATPNSQGYLLSNTVPAYIPLTANNVMLVDPVEANALCNAKAKE